MDDSMAALVAAAYEGGCGIGAVARRAQAAQDGVVESALNARMAEYLAVMRASIGAGMNPALRSLSGMTGGQAPRLRDAVVAGRTAGGELLGMASAASLAVAEANACMGKIVAAPTAGSCGILPGALLTVQRARDLPDSALVDALFTAAAVGQVIAKRASISGAEGGCQAECGSAAAMAAAALVEMLGGSPAAAADACSFALMNAMGLVCDPVGGLVEVPCVYRNVAGVANALTAADMALAGLAGPIPADEVIDAMRAVGERMPASLRETGEGGCAACPSARRA
ncbi:MAG: L-serine ammonia-lyase, iron-sulfur-dependent, subunit alpha [Clostridiales bacterium]|nr:L-serine ammonia-lyase, iron-sulfur-dependent, subunit alpha [Clostridiales bacterium]